MVFSLDDTAGEVGSLLGSLSGVLSLSGLVISGLSGPLASDSNQADFSFSLLADNLSIWSFATVKNIDEMDFRRQHCGHIR